MRSKRILSLVLALVMVLGTFGTVFAEPTDNVKVDWLIEKGLVQGYGDGTFGLDKSITRAEIATMVVRALDLEDIAKASAGFASPFTDMNTPAVLWARGYVTVTAGQGIVEGYPNGEFRPSNPITYAEVSAMMVRLMGGLTEEEEAKAVWPTTYLAKAVQLGVFEGVNGITDYNAPASREKVFEMIYNAVVNKQIGNYTIVKAIVLENNRVERLAKEEIVVEVIREVQRANQLDTAVYERGDQEKLVIDPKVGDVENLLGRVADFTLDKDGKVIAINEDETYKIEIVQDAATSNKFGKYTVEIGERYTGSDERIYRTYLNNKAYAYDDFYRLDPDREFEVDYARVTVKNGKVLFIDSFNFDDIMPVKEIKDIRSKATIVAYDDNRDGSTIEITVSDKEVILVKNNDLTKGTLEDVKMDNVIHSFKDGSSTEYLVLQDLAIEGKLDRVTETRTVTSVVVDGEAYDIPTAPSMKAVYEFKSNDKFYTLDAGTAYRELDTFRGEEVRVLLGLDGKLQYIGSPVAFGDFVGVATRIVGRDMRVLNPENKLNDYTANLDTIVDALNMTGTGHQNLNRIEKNALVYVNASDSELEEVVELMDPVSVISLDKRNIKLGQLVEGRTDFRLTEATTIYVVNTNGVAEVRTIDQVVKAFEKTGVTASASLISEGRYDSISIRGDKYARDENVFAIAFYDLDIDPKLEDAVYGKLIRFYDRRAGKSEIVVELSNGTRETFTLDRAIEGNVDFKVGLYYVIQESKDTEGLAIRVNKVSFTGHGTITRIEGNVYTLSSETGYVYEVRDTEFFGRKPRTGERISYVLTSLYNDLKLVVNPAVEDEVVPVTGGQVTYINPTTFEVEIEENGKVTLYKVTGAARLLFGTAPDSFDGAVVGDDVTVKLVDGNLRGLEIVKALTLKQSEALAAANLAVTKLTYKAVNSITDATKLAAAQNQYNAAKAAKDAYVALGGTTAITNDADIATQKTEIDRYVATKAVADAKAALELGLAAGDTVATVTKNITLKAADAGVTITWASANAQVTTAGVVTRPAHPGANVTGNLTATITSTLVGTINDTKVFSVTVLAAPESDLQKVTADAAALVDASILNGNSAINNILTDLDLITTGTVNNATITWSSNNTTFIANDGTVTRPANGSGDQTVTLTATLKVGTATLVKVFTTVVKELP